MSIQLASCAGELEEDVSALVASVPPAVNDSPRIPNTSAGGARVPTGGGGAGGGSGEGGGGSGEGGGGGGEGGDCDPQAIIEDPMKCGGGTCHGSPGVTPAFVNLGESFDDIGTRLKDVPGTAPCDDYNVIDSAMPSDSLLLTKLMDPAPCGEPMPYASMLSEDDQECLIAWAKSITGAP